MLSPLKSACVIEAGNAPALILKSRGAEKLPVPVPNITETLFPKSPVAAISIILSPLKSAPVIDDGVGLPSTKLLGGLKHNPGCACIAKGRRQLRNKTTENIFF